MADDIHLELYSTCLQNNHETFNEKNNLSKKYGPCLVFVGGIQSKWFNNIYTKHYTSSAVYTFVTNTQTSLQYIGIRG